MIKAFFNQPNPHVTIHASMACGFINRSVSKETRREIKINLLNLRHEMSKFEKHEIPFTATVGLNSLWVTVNLGNKEKEIAVVHEITRLLGDRYKAFRGIKPNIHCGL